MEVLDLQKWVGLEKSFAPHYQFEKPVEFYSLVNHYMKYNYDENRQPERYLSKMRYAVEFANKSLMADKLGIDKDVLGTHEFEKSFRNLAQQYDDLEVVNGRVMVTDSLVKSFRNEIQDKNLLYENLARQVCESINV